MLFIQILICIIIGIFIGIIIAFIGVMMTPKNEEKQVRELIKKMKKVSLVEKGNLKKRVKRLIDKI